MLNPNQIILELVATLRLATGDEVQTILDHIAQAPFATYLARVPNALRR